MLVLVGEGGAGPHDLARMMRQGGVYWTAAESQWYAEPKRLEQLGYLTAERQPGRTRPRTHYRLTRKGRQAIRDWVATPASLARIQNEPIARALAADLADPKAIAEGLDALREQLAAQQAGLDRGRDVARTLPHRERVLATNDRLARRMLDAQLELLDEIERDLEELSRERE